MLHINVSGRSAHGGRRDGMPRQARLDVPGLIHHVMARGIEGREIFRLNKERDAFLERLVSTAIEN